MKDCRFSGSKKGDSCSDCGFVLPMDYPRPPARNCGPPYRAQPVSLLGDRVAVWLDRIGVTQARYLRLREWLGRIGAEAVERHRVLLVANGLSHRQVNTVLRSLERFAERTCGCDRRRARLNAAHLAWRAVMKQTPYPRWAF